VLPAGVELGSKIDGCRTGLGARSDPSRKEVSLVRRLGRLARTAEAALRRANEVRSARANSESKTVGGLSDRQQACLELLNHPGSG
jgi:hypothetical protein